MLKKALSTDSDSLTDLEESEASLESEDNSLQLSNSEGELISSSELQEEVQDIDDKTKSSRRHDSFSYSLKHLKAQAADRSAITLDRRPSLLDDNRIDVPWQEDLQVWHDILKLGDELADSISDSESGNDVELDGAAAPAAELEAVENSSTTGLRGSGARASAPLELNAPLNYSVPLIKKAASPPLESTGVTSADKPKCIEAQDVKPGMVAAIQLESNKTGWGLVRVLESPVMAPTVGDLKDFKFLGQWMGDPNNLELDGMYVPLQEKDGTPWKDIFDRDHIIWIGLVLTNANRLKSGDRTCLNGQGFGPSSPVRVQTLSKKKWKRLKRVRD